MKGESSQADVDAPAWHIDFTVLTYIFFSTQISTIQEKASVSPNISSLIWTLCNPTHLETVHCEGCLQLGT